MRSKTADDKDNQVNHGRSTPFTRFAKKSPKGRCPKGSFRTAEKAMKYETGKQMSMKSRTRNMYAHGITKGVTEYHKKKRKALCDVDILNSLFSFILLSVTH